MISLVFFVDQSPSHLKINTIKADVNTHRGLFIAWCFKCSFPTDARATNSLDSGLTHTFLSPPLTVYQRESCKMDEVVFIDAAQFLRDANLS